MEGRRKEEKKEIKGEMRSWRKKKKQRRNYGREDRRELWRKEAVTI